MADRDFSGLRTRLLEGGVAPKHVRRTVTELRDHTNDLTAELIMQGFSGEDAAREAIARIGSDDIIAQDILAKPELKSWGARWPWAVYGLGPVVVFIFLSFMTVMCFGSVMVIGKAITGARYIPPVWYQDIVDASFLFAVYVLPLLVAAWVSWRMILEHSNRFWPIAGLLFLCFFSAASDLSMTWPATPDGPGVLQFGFAYAPPFPDQAETAFRAFFNILSVVLLMSFFRHRQRLARKD